MDRAGNLYIADTSNNRIRKVGTNGIITTVAGGGSGGDGGTATNASLSGPYGVVLDASGDLYIADFGDNCIREVNTNGIITTVAGGGAGGSGSFATNAAAYGPTSVAMDLSGDLYFAVIDYPAVEEVTTNGILYTVAGNGNRGYSGDGVAATNTTLGNSDGVAVDALGNLYITDYNNNRVRDVGTNGMISTVAGDGPNYPGTGGYSGDGGPATIANISHPTGAAVDPLGNLYFADENNNRIREVNTNGIISTVAGNGSTSFSATAARPLARACMIRWGWRSTSPATSTSPTPGISASARSCFMRNTPHLHSRMLVPSVPAITT